MKTIMANAERKSKKKKKFLKKELVGDIETKKDVVWWTQCGNKQMPKRCFGGSCG